MTAITDIFTTINNNKMHEAIQILRQIPLDSMDEHGRSPLMCAVQKNNLLLTAACLNAGFSPNQKNKEQLSPFIAAAANGFSDIFQLLLAYQPQVTQTNQFGGTALLPSSEKGYLKVVQAAIRAGVPVDHVNRLGWTALLEAVILGDGGFLYQEIILELMRAQADVTITDFLGKNALDYAEELHQPKVWAILKQQYSDGFADVRELLRAEKYFEALKQIAPLPDDTQKLFFLGYTFEMIKDYSASAFYYSEGLALDRQFSFYLANLENKRDNPEKALDYLDGGASSTNSRFLRYHKTNFLRKLGRHKEAIEETDRLLDELPNRVDYMFHKANSLRSLGNTVAAIEVLSQARVIMPQNPLFEEKMNRLMNKEKVQE